MLRRQNMSQTIYDHHRALPGVYFLLGDWNFVRTDETSPLSSGSEVRSGAHLAKFFEETFSSFVEMCQREHTFRRLARDAGAFSTLRRIDRIYASAHPSVLLQHTVQAWVKGDLTTRTSASDHQAVEVDIRLRRRQPPIRLKNYVPSHHTFLSAFADGMSIYDDITDAGVRSSAIIPAARAAPRRTLPIVRIGPDPPPHSVADLCLTTLNHVCAGRAALAANTARGTPCIKHTLADDGTIDIRKVCTTLQHSLDDATTRDIAAIERSGMPEIHKAAKRRTLRLRLEPYRPRRKRLTLKALYDSTGASVVDETAIGDLISEVWAPVFRAGRWARSTCSASSRSPLLARAIPLGYDHAGRLRLLQLVCHLRPQGRTACPTPSGRMRGRVQRILLTTLPSEQREEGISQTPC